jgi:spore germination cell wall hydrolase CwlJ-like protein
MLWKYKQFFCSLSYRLSPRQVWSDIRFYWLSGDRSNVVFSLIIVLVLTSLGLLITRTILIHQAETEIRCLALNIYHEARGEPEEGMYAVASVTLNRVASKHYPDTVCKVVYQKRWDYLRKRYVSAFSWTELDAPFSTDDRAWQKATHIAKEIYNNPDAQILKNALFYHARHIHPSWARKKAKVASIGRHIFYN